MVALVGAASGIQKREHPGYEKARFMHGHRVGTGENRSDFSVFRLAVAEKKRVVSEEKMAYIAAERSEERR